MTAKEVKLIREQIRKYERYAEDERKDVKVLKDEGDKREAQRQADINEAKAIALAHLLQDLGLYNE